MDEAIIKRFRMLQRRIKKKGESSLTNSEKEWLRNLSSIQKELLKGEKGKIFHLTLNEKMKLKPQCYL